MPLAQACLTSSPCQFLRTDPNSVAHQPLILKLPMNRTFTNFMQHSIHPHSFTSFNARLADVCKTKKHATSSYYFITDRKSIRYHYYIILSQIITNISIIAQPHTKYMTKSNLDVSKLSNLRYFICN